MYLKEVFATIRLAHHFNSAFSGEQVYRYLRVKIEREEFEGIIAELKRRNLIFEKNDALFTTDMEKSYCRKKIWSKELFRRQRLHLSLISGMPWVKYAALTGANAFESCRRRDDIDLFLITAGNRLWICYLLLVVLSKIFRKREVLCINFLVDENNLHIRQHDYYTAVQIMQMIPLFDNDFSQKIIDRNRWVFRFLPNAAAQLKIDRFYLLRNGKHFLNGNLDCSGPLGKLNRAIYRKYARRLSAKYPREFGKGIVLEEGLAKLNRIDHHDIYEEIYQKIYRETEESLLKVKDEK